MNSKFIKKNKWLVLALGVGGVLAVILAVFAIILTVQWAAASKKTQDLKNEIETINKRKPGPGNENAKAIQSDIAFYQKKLASLFSQCRGPMDAAVDAFLTELKPPLAKKLSEEEIEAYKVKEEESDKAEEDDKASKTPVIARLDKNQFRKFFKDRFDKYLEKNAGEESERHTNVMFQTFIAEFRGNFPEGSWDKAVNKFADEAAKVTLAPIEDSNREAMLVNALGFERFVDGDTAAFQRYMGNFAARVQKAAETKQLRLVGNALNFMVQTQFENSSSREAMSSGGAAIGGMTAADFAIVLFQWDIFGDIIQRVSAKLGDKGGILYGVTLRNKGGASGGGEPGMDDKSAGLNPENYFETESGYKVYHYTLEMSVEMSQLRDIVKSLDMGYKDNRTYVVRSWSIYAENNGAAVLMKQVDSGADKVEEQQKAEDRPGRSFRRRRGRRLDEEDPRPRARRSTPDETGKEEPTQEELEALEAQKPPHERRDYGAILIGGDVNRKCRVFIDVDYLVREESQE